MYWEPERECMDREELKQLQLEQLQATLSRAYMNVPFYRKKFDEMHVDPDECRSLDDLHLVEIKEDEPYASLLCANCREKRAATIDTSIPLSLVSRVIINRFLTIKEINETDVSVSDYTKLLEAEFASKWEALIRSRNKPEQKSLFGTDDKKGTLL